MELHVTEVGPREAPILVFLHGGGISSWMWKRQVAYFKENYFVLTIDLPSHGYSRDVPFQTITKAAAEIISIMEQYRNGQSIMLIGFSLGAQIALEILSLNADVVDRAVIISALTEPMQYSSSLLLPALKMSLPLVRNRTFSKIQAKYAYIEPEDMDTYYEDTVQMRAEAFIAFMKENMAYRIAAGYEHNKADILVLAGGKERHLMKKSATNLVRQNDRARGYIVPGIGHGLSLADPKLFHQILESWLHGHRLPDQLIAIRYK